MKHILIILALLVIISNDISSQIIKNFDKTYGSNQNDVPYKAFYRNGKTFVFGNIYKVSGGTNNVTNSYGVWDYNMVVYDNSGVKIKDSSFGGRKKDSLLEVFDFDSTFVLVGISQSDNGAGKAGTGSELNNSSLYPAAYTSGINSERLGYREIYCVRIDYNGTVLKELSVPITNADYMGTDMMNAEDLVLRAVASNSLIVYTGVLAKAKIKMLIDIVGVGIYNDEIKIMTREMEDITRSPVSNAQTNVHTIMGGTDCAHTTTIVPVGSNFQYESSVNEYTIKADLSNYSLDKTTKFDGFDMPTNTHYLNNCPNAPSCGNFTHHDNTYTQPFFPFDDPFYGTTLMVTQNSQMQNPPTFPSGGSIKNYLPNIYKAWYVNGDWILGIKGPWSYGLNTSYYNEVNWYQHTHYDIGQFTFVSQNNFSAKPVDITFHNGKYYIFIEDLPNQLPGNNFNQYTPTPNGNPLLGTPPAGYIRTAPSAPISGKKDIWVVECSGTPNPDPSAIKRFYKPVLLSAPLRQIALKANNDIIYKSMSEVFDTSKVMMALSTSATAQFDKSDGNKGGVDYWPVKFDFDKMRISWDTTFGGALDDILTTTELHDGVLLTSGTSKSQAGFNKSEPSFSTLTWDYWTMNICFPPNISFTSDIQLVNPGDVVTFTNYSTNAGEFKWDFYDNVLSYDRHPHHYYNNPGTYDVKLIASNGNCSATLTKANYVVVNGFVGLDELSTAREIGIYPNPNEGIISITGKYNKIEVFDVMGKNVDSRVIEHKLFYDACPGIYFIKITGEHEVKTFKTIRK